MMSKERWEGKVSPETTKKAEDFLNEIVGVCRRYDLSLSHEDCHGAFVVAIYDDRLTDWLMNADPGNSLLICPPQPLPLPPRADECSPEEYKTAVEGYRSAWMKMIDNRERT